MTDDIKIEDGSMLAKEMRERLFALRDEKYAAFQSRLIPDMPKEKIIGVRTPELRKYAAELAGTEGIELFLRDLPHKFFEENQLHSFIISREKDMQRCLEETQLFLPYIDNWATCDQLAPKVFAKHKRELLPCIKAWMASAHCYTVRFGIGMLMAHFLDEDFEPCYPEWVAVISSEEYYVNMMRAWFFATALTKQYEATLPVIERQTMDAFTHNKSIQKAVESFRISDEQKAYLKTLKL